MAQHTYVSDIDVKSLPENVSPEFKDMLISSLKEQLQNCAKGTQPLRLVVSVAQFSGQNAAMTLLAGSSDKIKGSAQLIDPADGTTVGDFDIAYSMGGGGVFGALALSGAEKKMATGFANEVCDRAYKHAR